MGNSFTHGAYSPVITYNSAAITDVNGTGYGGIPGIFKKMTDGAGLSYNVTIEAVSSMTLAWHYANKASIIGQSKWNIVVLQEQSVGPVPVSHGGAPSTFYAGASECQSLVLSANPAANVLLYETWAYPAWVGANGYASGTPGLQAMQTDLQSGYTTAFKSDNFTAQSPVGDAFMQVINQGLADPNNAVVPGEFQLWNSSDNKHPSIYGAYLSAAVFFGKITGLDPRTISVGTNSAAAGLGIASTDAQNLNQIAYEMTLAPQSSPVITSGLTASGSVGTAFNYSIGASNTPTAYNATGLPAGLTVNTGTGAITGNPAGAGTSDVTISASNSSGIGSLRLALTVNSSAVSVTKTLEPLTGTSQSAPLNWNNSNGNKVWLSSGSLTTLTTGDSLLINASSAQFSQVANSVEQTSGDSISSLSFDIGANTAYVQSNGSAANTRTMTLTGGSDALGGTDMFHLSSATTGTANIGTSGAAGIGPLDIILAANGTVEVENATATLNFGSLAYLSGTFNLTKTGAGTVTFAGTNANTFGGSGETFTIAAGTVRVSSAAALANSATGLTITGGTLDINTHNETMGPLQIGDGTINGNVSGTTGVLTVAGINAKSGTVSAILAGAGALTKSSGATVTLSGNNTYSGPTAIDGGALVVNGSLAAGSAVNVSIFSILGGSGSINGATTLAYGGILAPGFSSVSTLTLAGGLTLTAGAVLDLNLGSSSDRVAVSGSYTAPTGTVTVNITAVSGFGVGTYSLITGASGISASSFALGTVPAGYSYNLSAASGTLSLVVTPQAPTGLTATAGNGQVALAWSGSGSATSYSVLRATVSGGPYTAAGSTTGTSYIDTRLTNGTPYYYVAVALNSGIASANSNEAFATPLSPFQQYLLADNLPISTADSATPDGDGVSILLKYATAMTPGSPSAAGPAAIGLSGSNLTLQFNRISPATVTYTVEASSDLVNWTSVANLASGAASWTGTASVSEAGSSPVNVTVTDSAAMSSSAPRFLRLRVTTATDTAVLGTVPEGGVPLSFAGAATSASSLTLDNDPVSRNTVQAVTASSVTVVNASSWVTVSTPYALRLLSGTASGATFTVTAQSGNVLTLATNGIDLTQILSVGDTYEVLPLETLGSLFGTSIVPFQTGTSASSADNIQLWNGSGWLTYYPNGTAWKQAGSLLSQNNVPLPSGIGWLTLRRGATPVVMYILGRVPEVPLRQFTVPGGTTFVGGAYPLRSTLLSTGFASSTGWLSGSSASSADNLLLWGGANWLTFYYNGTNWKQSGSLLNQSGFSIPAGQPIYTVRHSSPAAAEAFILQPLPYTP